MGAGREARSLTGQRATFVGAKPQPGCVVVGFEDGSLQAWRPGDAEAWAEMRAASGEARGTVRSAAWHG